MVVLSTPRKVVRIFKTKLFKLKVSFSNGLLRFIF